MTKHKHRFVATAITGRNMTGKECILGWRINCEQCNKQAKEGDLLEEIKASWWKEIIPKSKPINIILKEASNV